MAEQEVPAGQRAGAAAGRGAPEHALVLRGGALRGPGHQAHAELWEDQVQADIYRPPPELYYPGTEAFLYLVPSVPFFYHRGRTHLYRGVNGHGTYLA